MHGLLLRGLSEIGIANWRISLHYKGAPNVCGAQGVLCLFGYPPVDGRVPWRHGVFGSQDIGSEIRRHLKVNARTTSATSLGGESPMGAPRRRYVPLSTTNSLDIRDSQFG
jgi:hypothetical protein